MYTNQIAMNKTVTFLIAVFLTVNNFAYSQKNTAGADKCYLYLTFDDGPLNGSENINTIILQEKIKISVFMVGEHVIKDKQMDTYAKYYDQIHTLMNIIIAFPMPTIIMRHFIAIPKNQLMISCIISHY